MPPLSPWSVELTSFKSWKKEEKEKSEQKKHQAQLSAPT